MHVLSPFYKHLIKPIFFKFDPELVHDRVTNLGQLLGSNFVTRGLISKLFAYQNPVLTQKYYGLTWPNPVGLGAGFDKDANLIQVLPSVGFGFAEIGSVTWEAYAGNPQPRLFRLPKSQALVVYYGLKNLGVHKIVERIKTYLHSNMVVGVSIAKTNCSRTNTDAAGVEDYFLTLQYLIEQNVGDYYTINVSCPNTFGGEPFTTAARLEMLLAKLSQLEVTKPVFVKLPINLPIAQFDELLQIAVKYKLTGVVIGNLNKERSSQWIKDLLPDNIKGGISGKPTWELSNQLIAYTYKHYGDKLKIIGLGGIFSAADAYTKIKLGASLVQLVTGLIYQGPQLIGQINKELVQLLQRDGYSNISQAIGVDNIS
jgi:dihydroorotate dehydrogenase